MVSNAPAVREGGTVLVLGATGFVGARLVPALLSRGYRVRAAGRTLKKLRLRPWSASPGVELCRVDVLRMESLKHACRGVDAVYYLVHSMEPGSENFRRRDKQAGMNMAEAAAKEKVSRILYLGGLGESGPSLSEHLKSRREVGDVLRSSGVPVTELRAAMVLGAASGSFEILRYLVERLPVMVTPKWVRTRCQPVAVEDVVRYLADCLSAQETSGNTYDIGGPDILSYHDLMRIYAEEAGLWKRWVVPVPVLTPRLSSYWIHLVTPLNASLAVPLTEGLSNEVICRDNRIEEILPGPPRRCREAIRKALDWRQFHLPVDDLSNTSDRCPVAWVRPGDPFWAGGTVLKDTRRIRCDAESSEIWRLLSTMGAGRGYYHANYLWKLRGCVDRLLGGPGLQKHVSVLDHPRTGDRFDFWRVAAVRKNQRLLFKSEMVLPGTATLEFLLDPAEEGGTVLTLVARFIPAGIGGIVYWGLVYPFHAWVFNGMIRNIVEMAGGKLSDPPGPLRRRKARK